MNMNYIIPYDDMYSYKEIKKSIYQNKQSNQIGSNINSVLNTIDSYVHNVLFGNSLKYPKITMLSSYIDISLFNSYIAISRDACISLFNLQTNSWNESLLHHSTMDNGIYCIKWLPDCDVLLVGTTEGIACWRINNLNSFNNNKSSISTQNKLDFYMHPNRRPIHTIEVCKNGRLFASLTIGEAYIYIWDSNLDIKAPLYCLDNNTAQSISWSPSGLYIIISDRSGGIVAVDTYNWQYSICCEIKPIVPSVCWLNDELNICYTYGQLGIYSINMPADIVDNTNHPSFTNALSFNRSNPISISPLPLLLNTNDFNNGEILGITNIKCSCNISNDKNNKYIAVSFVSFQNESEQIFNGLAIYLVNFSPMLSFTFIKVIRSTINVSDTIDSRILPVSYTFIQSSKLKVKESEDDWVIVESLSLVQKYNIQSQSNVYICVSWSNGFISFDTI